MRRGYKDLIPTEPPAFETFAAFCSKLLWSLLFLSTDTHTEQRGVKISKKRVFDYGIFVSATKKIDGPVDSKSGLGTVELCRLAEIR